MLGGKKSLLCPGAYPQIESQVWVLEAPVSEKQCLRESYISTRRLLLIDLLTFLNLLAQGSFILPAKGCFTCGVGQGANDDHKGSAGGCAFCLGSFWRGGSRGTQLTSPGTTSKGEFAVS